ncbi:unnamed protein product [Adineta ricciae]|uniref:Uncharacterized protein n=1 Tax=Adineta ricciae TaxID=249248 RepID=A0A814TFB8_ADIRI|nr:unnamed protein product [Adineta ricciae]CAF1464135.1 unnamed protein product [Adineta ricciae]
MTKWMIFHFVFSLTLIFVNGKCNSKQITSISSGTSFGMCVGYCRRSISIKSQPKYQLIALKEPNYSQNEYPTEEKRFSYTEKQWKKLINLLDVKNFEKLNETIGCPDCADGGAEWIEIQCKTEKKRVTFEYGQLIKGFEGIINELRNLRETFQI